MQPSETSALVRPGGPQRDPVILNPVELDSVPMCRICFNNQSNERLLKPCKCKGSIQYVHRSCLEHWLTSNNVQSCEICKYHYKTARERLTCWEWLKSKNGKRERCNMIVDLACFVFITILGLATLWLCVEGAAYYMKIKNSILEMGAVIMLAMFLIISYAVWITLCIRFHWVVWSREDSRWRVCVIDREGVSTSSSSSTSVVSATVTLEPRSEEGENVRRQTRVHYRAYDV